MRRNSTGGDSVSVEDRLEEKKSIGKRLQRLKKEAETRRTIGNRGRDADTGKGTEYEYKGINWLLPGELVVEYKDKQDGFAGGNKSFKSGVGKEENLSSMEFNFNAECDMFRLPSYEEFEPATDQEDYGSDQDGETAGDDRSPSPIRSSYSGYDLETGVRLHKYYNHLLTSFQFYE